MLNTSPGFCHESRQALNEPQQAAECQVGTALSEMPKYTLVFKEIKGLKMCSLFQSGGLVLKWL